jgi:hypothetical protein
MCPSLQVNFQLKVFNFVEESQKTKKSTNFRKKLLRKNLSTTLLPGTKFISYKLIKPTNRTHTIQYDNAPASPYSKTNSDSKKNKPEFNKSRLKRSETHKILNITKKSFDNKMKTYNQFKDNIKSIKNSRSINLKKKLYKKYVKNEGLANTKLKLNSEKIMTHNAPKKIIKWKDYIRMIKAKQFKDM